MVLSSADNGQPRAHTLVHNYRLTIHARYLSRKWRALIDRGANGCIIGSDMRVIAQHHATINLNGIDDHTVANLPLVQSGGVVRTDRGHVILIIHQGAHMPDGKTILSPGQMEAFGWRVYDTPKHTSGVTPYCLSADGYRIPMSIRAGLPYISLRPFTDDEWRNLPHVVATSPAPWDPSCLDSLVEESWYSSQPESTYLRDSDYDEYGEPKPDRFPATIPEDASRHPRAAYRCEIYDLGFLDPPHSRSSYVQTRSQRSHRPAPAPAGSPNGEDILPPHSTETQPHRSHRRHRKLGSPAQRRMQLDGESPSSEAPGELPPQTEDSLPDLVTRIKNEYYDSDSSDNESSVGSLDELDHMDALDKDGDTPYGLPAFQTRAKSATGIDYPPRRWQSKPGTKRQAEKLRKFFPGASLATIRKTLDATTQYATKGAVEGTTLRQQIQAPNPVLNIPRRQEDVATDTLYSNTPAVDDGSTACQFFIGRTSKFRSVHPLGTSDAKYVSALMDEIRKRGAMNRIISDSAKAEISERVKEILRTFIINDRQSEGNKQWQNFAERGWRDTKSWTNNVLNISGAPAYCWLLALEYVCHLQNHVAYASLGWRTPTEWLQGYTPDISPLIQFIFYEPVFYRKHADKFPSDSTECIGRFVGISENVGNPMTYKVLTEHLKVVSKGEVRTATKGGAYQNLRAQPDPEELPDEEVDEQVREFRKNFQRDVTTDPAVLKFRDKIDREIVHSKANCPESELPSVDIKGLVGRTFITNPDDDGEQHRGKVLQAYPTGDMTPDGKEAILRFKCQHGDRMFEEIMTYNKMLEWCDRDLDKDDMYKIDAILDHRKAKLPSTKGGIELLIQWASGVRSWNCGNLTFNDDPVSVAMYALKNNLLDTEGFKRCRPYVKNAKKFGRMINQTRLKNYRRRPVYKYGYQVPRDHEEAVFIDEKNGNTKWQDSESLEKSQLHEYDTFKDLGKGAAVPEGYQKIPCHMVYDVKHDGRHKSRFVAGGHRTSTPTESVYSGVVTLQGIRLITFLSELNDLELWGTDVGNAYLESYTTEKVCFIAGGEFGELAGHLMIIVKALYGLKSSGRCWHDRLFEVLQSMGFTPSKAEPDIWMRRVDDHYEYIASYVDDLLIASKNPQGIIDALEAKPHKFTLKGTGEVKFHLGCDFFRDSQGTLCVGPKKYIERLADQYKSMFGQAPCTKVTSPLNKDDHPELDISPLLDEDGITQYQSLIGAMQWVITLGRFDFAVAVMTMSSFRAAPRTGHLERLKRMVGYLVKMKNGFIRVRTGEPDYSDLPAKTYDWSHTVYGEVKEVLPHDAPAPLGKRVVFTTYVDANLYHDWATGRAVSGVLHFINQTPFEWFTKKQPTVETATYGSEFVAAKMAAQQIIGIRTTLRYLGVPVHGPTKMFGDNHSVVTSASTPQSPLKKRHHALAYHFTREAIASNVLDFHHIPGQINPADILSKHWGYSQIWPILQPILFWMGDTADLLPKEE